MKRLTSATTKPFYSDLGVSEYASPGRIHEAFLNISRSHHPDLHDDAARAELFRRAKYAHDLLMDPEKRRFIDRNEGSDPNGNMDRIQAMMAIRKITQDILSTGQVDCDIVATVRSTLQQSRAKCCDQLTNTRAVIRTSERMMANIERRFKGPESIKQVMLGMLREQLGLAPTQIEQLERHIREFDCAIAMMGDCQWEMPTIVSRYGDTTFGPATISFTGLRFV